MVDKDKQRILDDELDEAVAEAEDEYASADQLIDTREALPQLKSKHFGKNIEAMRTRSSKHSKTPRNPP